MAKLIHSAALSYIKNSALVSNQVYTQTALSALMFTNDGFIVAKGTEYQVPLASNAERATTPAAGNTDFTQRCLWSDNGILKLIDSARFDYTGPHIDYVKLDPLAASSTMYLAGSTSSASTTEALKTKSTVYVTTTAAGNATLVAPSITVSGGASQLILNNQSLTDYISGLVISGIQTNDAMVFAGTLQVVGSDLYFRSHSNNLDYGVEITDYNGSSNLASATKLSQITKYSSGWTFKIVGAGGTPTGFETLEIGDMIIASNSNTSGFAAADFSAIQANIDGALTASANLPANALLIGADGTKSVGSLGYGTSGNYLKSNGSGAAPSWASFGSLTFDATTNDFSFSPDSAKTLNIGDGLDITSTGSGTSAVYTLGMSKLFQTAQTSTELKKFSYDVYGRITGTTDVAKLTFKALNSSGSEITGSGVTNKEYDGNTAAIFALKAGDNITLEQAESGIITIKSAYQNTWRAIEAFLLTGSSLAASAATIGTNTLKFSSTFAHKTSGSNPTISEIDLVWADVDASGNITYSF